MLARVFRGEFVKGCLEGMKGLMSQEEVGVTPATITTTITTTATTTTTTTITTTRSTTTTAARTY